jgi:hypothetical protein
MKFSKNQIVVVLAINLFMLSMSVFQLIKWIGVSNIKTIACLCSSFIFLFFVVIVIRKHYSLLTK